MRDPGPSHRGHPRGCFQRKSPVNEAELPEQRQQTSCMTAECGREDRRPPGLVLGPGCHPHPHSGPRFPTCNVGAGHRGPAKPPVAPASCALSHHAESGGHAPSISTEPQTHDPTQLRTCQSEETKASQRLPPKKPQLPVYFPMAVRSLGCGQLPTSHTPGDGGILLTALPRTPLPCGMLGITPGTSHLPGKQHFPL